MGNSACQVGVFNLYKLHINLSIPIFIVAINTDITQENVL